MIERDIFAAEEKQDEAMDAKFTNIPKQNRFIRAYHWVKEKIPNPFARKNKLK
jgi:hypothetical protein